MSNNEKVYTVMDIVELLRLEGYSSEEVQVALLALSKLKEEAKKQPKFKGSLDEYLDSITDENKHEEIDFGKPQGKELL